MNKLDILINDFGIKHINYKTFEKDELSISFYTNQTGKPSAAVNDIKNWIIGAEITYKIDSDLYFHYFDEDPTFDDKNIEKRLNEVASYLLKQFLNIEYYKKIEEDIKTYSRLKKKHFYSLHQMHEINLNNFKIYELFRTNEEYISAKTNKGADGKYRTYTDNIFFIKYDGVLVQDGYLNKFFPNSTEEIVQIGSFSREDNLSIVFRKDLTDIFKTNYSKNDHEAILQNN